MNKQKTLLITFLVDQRTKSQKTASLFLVKLVLTEGNHWQMSNMFKKTEVKRREAQMELLQYLKQRSPVNAWKVRTCYETHYCKAERVHKNRPLNTLAK